MKRRGILFSGTKENVSLALSHIHKHGIIYWCLPVNLKYDEFYFPVIALLHVKGDIVRYKCIISDIMPYSSCHFLDPKKKPITWIKGQKVEKRKYKITFTISKMTPFSYSTKRLKNWNGGYVGNAPQGYTKVMIP